VKQIEFGPDFKKSFKKRFQNTRLENKIAERIDLFIANRTSPTLKDHKLKGELERYRAFSITRDIRIIYLEEKGKIIFLDVGKHNQVY